MTASSQTPIILAAARPSDVGTTASGWEATVRSALPVESHSYVKNVAMLPG
jgi:hypothetical protein